MSQKQPLDDSSKDTLQYMKADILTFFRKASWLRCMALPIALFMAMSTVSAFALEPKRDDQQDFLTRAVFAERTLWVRSDAGRLFRIAEDKDTPREEKLPQPALDLCLLGGQPAVITCETNTCKNWALRRLKGGVWQTETVVPLEGDDVIALSCEAANATLLTNHRLIELSTPQPNAVALSGKMGPGRVASVHVASDVAFVGLNAGEWGGGLRRIDRHTGKVSVIESNEAGELCGGLLNAECDPVNGIADEPGHPGCVVAAVGLVHFAPHGRLVEVCGDKVRRLYFKAYGDNPKRDSNRGGEPFETVAFFGLVREGETLWAAGIDGIYKGEAGEFKLAAPLPAFKNVGPFQVSFALPHIVLLVTRVNQRHSISGGVPMLVTR